MITHRSGKGGFTLIELLIVVAVVGVLAAIAFPSYTNYVTKNNRFDAKEALQGIQMAQERFRLREGEYSTSLAALGFSETQRGLYTLSLNNVTRNGYTVTAVARDRQQRDITPCRTLTLQVTMVTERRLPEECW